MQTSLSLPLSQPRNVFRLVCFTWSPHFVRRSYAYVMKIINAIVIVVVHPEQTIKSHAAVTRENNKASKFPTLWLDSAKTLGRTHLRGMAHMTVSAIKNITNWNMVHFHSVSSSLRSSMPRDKHDPECYFCNPWWDSKTFHLFIHSMSRRKNICYLGLIVFNLISTGAHSVESILVFCLKRTRKAITFFVNMLKLCVRYIIRFNTKNDLDVLIATDGRIYSWWDKVVGTRFIRSDFYRHRLRMVDWAIVGCFVLKSLVVWSLIFFVCLSIATKRWRSIIIQPRLILWVCRSHNTLLTWVPSSELEKDKNKNKERRGWRERGRRTEEVRHVM